MKPGGLMPHSQGLSSNPYPEQNQPIHHILNYYIHFTMRNLYLLEFLEEAYRFHVHHFHCVAFVQDQDGQNINNSLC